MANRYKTSSGEYMVKSVIDSRIKKAKARVVSEREHYCQATGRTDERIDCSHIISVKRCQEMGKSELAYDTNNIQLESRTAHMEWESWEAFPEKVRNHANFDYKLEYIKTHDHEGYLRFKSVFGLPD